MITFALPNRKKRGEKIKKTFFEILRHKTIVRITKLRTLRNESELLKIKLLWRV